MEEKRLPPLNSVEECSAAIIAEFLREIQKFHAVSQFSAGVWLLYHMDDDDIKLIPVPDSHRIFEPTVNKRKTIHNAANQVTSIVRAESGSPNAKLLAVIASYDAYLNDVSHLPPPPPGKSIHEYLKEMNYVQPEQGPQHKEALICTIAFKDHEKLYTFRYDRRGKSFYYHPPEIEVNPEYGMVTKIYPPTE